MKLFIDRLIEEVQTKDSHVCVGLDPHIDNIPPFLIAKAQKECKTKAEAYARAVWWFNQEIIEAIADLVAVVKPQIAFYELLGVEGLRVLEKTVDYAQKRGLLVLLDGKRNDIGSTAQAYAKAYLSNEGNMDIVADALTINPYLGFDGIKPFLEEKERGAFALLKTSNTSSGEIQDLLLNNEQKVYQKVGQLIEKWGKEYRGKYNFSNLGAVVGATYPEELKLLRKEMPHTYFLIPGYGAQGGVAQDIVAGFNQDNLGAIINSSRGIIFAYQNEPKKYREEEFGMAAREATRKMRYMINQAIIK